MRTANSGMSGSVTPMTTPDIQSAAATLASTASGTKQASTSCGRYLAKYASRASRPVMASVVISPTRWPDSQDGPSLSALAVRPRRSCDLIRAAARSVAASPP